MKIYIRFKQHPIRPDIGNQVISITRKELEELKEKFDPEKAYRDQFKLEWTIQKSCSFCERFYDEGCVGCTFSRTPRDSCLKLIQTIVHGFPRFELHPKKGISWRELDHWDAVANLTLIQGIIKKALRGQRYFTF